MNEHKGLLGGKKLDDEDKQVASGMIEKKGRKKKVKPPEKHFIFFVIQEGI